MFLQENIRKMLQQLHVDYVNIYTALKVLLNIVQFDIGKIFIPAEILQKPAKLTDEEYEVIKTHTTIGYEMCMKDLKLRPYSAGPLYHHEALNGTGYPRGLSKKENTYRKL